ncbi:WD40/YVTN/BNR-like repeat-containing protein [Acidobacteriota bacterium]
MTRKHFTSLIALILSLGLVAAGCGERAERPAGVVLVPEAMPDQPGEAHQFFMLQRLPPGHDHYPLEHLRVVEVDLEIRESRIEKSRAISRGRMKRLASWTALGPGNTGGRTRALVVDPANPDVMLAGGVGGGVWRTANGGASWASVTDMLPNQSVSTIAMAPSDPDVVYAGTGEGFMIDFMIRGLGVYRSFDRGLTWEHLKSTVEEVPEGAFEWVNDIVVSPTDPHRVYAATRFGVWRSEDGGDNWSVVLANPRHLRAEHESLACAIGATELAIRGDSVPDVIFAAFGSWDRGGLYRSTDGGETWEEITPTSSRQGRMSIAISPSNNNVIYVSMAQNRSGTYGKLENIFRSNDGGGNWSPRVNMASALGPWLLSFSAGAEGCMNYPMYHMGQYAHTIAVDPLDPGILWLGGVYLFRSDNGGRTFAYADGPLGGPRAFYHLNHPDNHAIVFHPGFDGGLNQTVFVASDGGIARSNDARGRTSSSFCALVGDIEWTNLNNDYATTQFYHGDSAAGGELFLGGSHDNGTNLTRGFESFNDWRTVFLGDGGYVAIDPRDSDVFYVEMQGFPSIYRTDDGGHSFRLETTGITEQTDLFLAPLAMDPTNPDIMWTGGRSPWRYSRQSARWARAGGMEGNGWVVSAIAVAPSDSDVVYLGHMNGALARTGNGLDSSPSWDGRSAGLPRAYISSLAVDPADPDVAYCTFSTFGVPHVFRTDNGGLTWTSIDGEGDTGIPDISVHWIAVRPCMSRQLWVGTELGVFVSNDTGATWHPSNYGLPRTVVESLDFMDAHTLVAFTYGRGAFIADLEPCGAPRRVSRRVRP